MFEMIPRGAVGGRSRRRAHLFAIHSTLTHSLNSLWIDFVQLIDTHTPIKSTGDLSLYKAATLGRWHPLPVSTNNEVKNRTTLATSP